MFRYIFSKLLQINNTTAYKVSKATKISNGLLSEYKSGIKTPSSENLKKISEYFNVSTDLLLGNSDSTLEIIKEELYKHNRSKASLEEFIGLSEGTVDKWLTGQNVTFFEYLSEIADFFEVTVLYLLGDNFQREALAQIDDETAAILLKYEPRLRQLFVIAVTLDEEHLESLLHEALFMQARERYIEVSE